MERSVGRDAGPRSQKWLRADRFATLYVVGPMRQWVAPFRESRIPILMYHSVSEQESGGRHPYFETTTAIAEHIKFSEQRIELSHLMRH